MKRERDLVITGVPRSGSTLTCHLLNDVPNTVALHEPMSMARFAQITPAERLARVEAFFDRQRESLLRDGTARSMQVDGMVPDNPFGENREPRGNLRSRVVSKGTVRFDRPLDDDMILCIKHNAGYTAMLDLLATRFRCVAVVRNPLASLASWNSVEIRASEGRLPVAERMLPELAARLDGAAEVHERQLEALAWIFETFATSVPRDDVVRYEDLVASGGSVLERWVPGAASLSRTLENRNRNRQYDHALMQRLGEAVLARRDAAWWHFYDRDEVARNLEEPS